METAPPPGRGPEPSDVRSGDLATSSLLALTEQWLDCWWNAVRLGCADLPAAVLTDPRRTRNAWLADLTVATDRYLRSPAFLDCMRQSLSVFSRPTGPFPHRSK
jgi:hypothetical protein